ncbi:MAG: hypothetical protein NTV86_13060 [Planctomycetota bacterium]|nr:hypothetical protein [Planctomycetota bacterium]
MATYHDPRDVTLGGTALAGVLEIRYGVTAEPVTAGGDGQTHASVVVRGPGVCRGELVFRDPVGAQTAAGRGGTLTARLQGLAGAADRTLTIRGVRVLSEEGHVSRTRQGGCLVRFAAARDDGTDPVSVA